MSTVRAWDLDRYIPVTYNGTSASVQTQFWSLFKFYQNLTGSYPDLGLSIVAYNHGITTYYAVGSVATAGTNRFDQGALFANNAWFCVRYSSASNPFDMLFQLRTRDDTSANTTFGSTPGNPGLLEGVNLQNSAGAGFGYAFIGWAIAMRSDGGICWNGSSASNGADTKGTVVWQSGLTPPASGSGFFTWPRNNSPIMGTFGSIAASRQNCMYLTAPGATNDKIAPNRWHMYTDKDTFWYMQDAGDDTSYNRMCYFGPYTPLTSSNITPSYLCFAGTSFNPGTTFGHIALANPDLTNYYNGGVCHPFASGSGTMSFIPNYNSAIVYTPNNCYPGGRQIFTQAMTINVNDAGATNAAGWCGTFPRLPLCYGPSNNDISGSWGAFGLTTVANAVKWLFTMPTGSAPGVFTTPFVGQQYIEVIP